MAESGHGWLQLRLRFTAGTSCDPRRQCHYLSRGSGAKSTSLARIRPPRHADSPSRESHLLLGPLHLCSAVNKGSLSRADGPDAKGRTLAATCGSPRTLAIDGPQPQPTSPAAPQNKRQGSHERALVLPPANRTRPPIVGASGARKHGIEPPKQENEHDRQCWPKAHVTPESRGRPQNAKGDAPSRWRCWMTGALLLIKSSARKQEIDDCCWPRPMRIYRGLLSPSKANVSLKSPSFA